MTQITPAPAQSVGSAVFAFPKGWAIVDAGDKYRTSTDLDSLHDVRNVCQTPTKVETHWRLLVEGPRGRFAVLFICPSTGETHVHPEDTQDYNDIRVWATRLGQAMRADR